MILPTGEVVPGMKTTRASPLEAAFVWCAALVARRHHRLLRHRRRGEDLRACRRKGGDGKPRRASWPTLDAAWVTSLAVRADGTLLAGTTPGGSIFTVDPKTGAAQASWPSCPPSTSGRSSATTRPATTYVGTGAPGKIFAVDAKGASRAQLWDSGDKHVVSLVRGDDGTLLAGTSEEAILYRVGLDGRAEALQDFEAEEVRAIARAGDASTWRSTTSSKTAPAVAGRRPTPAKGTKIPSRRAAPPPRRARCRGPGQRKAKAARLPPGARRPHRAGLRARPTATSPRWRSTTTGERYAATGTQGRVYRIARRSHGRAGHRSARAAGADAACAPARTSWSAPATSAASTARGPPAAERGELSVARCSTPSTRARWGTCAGSGTHGLTFETRSGNTAKPDETWTAFARSSTAPPRRRSGGAGARRQPARALPAVPATLGAARRAPARGDVAYLPQNQRARITELTLGRAAPPRRGHAAAARDAGARAHSPILKLRWKVENPDGDELDLSPGLPRARARPTGGRWAGPSR